MPNLIIFERALKLSWIKRIQSQNTVTKYLEIGMLKDFKKG